MPFTVTITEVSGPEIEPFSRFQQTVDSLDLMKVIQAVNTPPPAAPVAKKPRKDKGVKRPAKTEVPA